MKLVFMGTPAAAVPSLQRLIDEGHEISAVYTQPDRPSGRGNKVSSSPVKQIAKTHNIEIRQPLKIRTDEAYQQFRTLSADAAIVVAYGRILPERWLNAFPRGAINVHFSLLPKYRGAAPVNWAIVNGESKTGVTTMRMDTGLDTGAILLQRFVDIGSEETSIELMDRLAGVGSQLLSETIASLSTITPTEQDGSAASFAPILRREDGLVNWNMSANEIADRIRGFQPFPTTFTFLEGRKITLWKANAVRSVGDPGEIVSATGDELVACCGSGTALTISEIQPEGKRRMPVRDFLNGMRVKEGDRFGD